MASKRNTPAEDFESRYFDIIQDSLGRLEDKIDSNTKLTDRVRVQAEKTNGRVTTSEGRLDKLDKEVFGKVKPSDLPSWWRDPKILGILFNITIIILVFLSFLAKVDIGTLLP